MGSSIKWALVLGAGMAGGWAIRSLADSPEGAGVKLLEAGIKAKDRISGWAAVERERLDDMLAEAHSNIARENTAANKPGHAGPSAMRRSARPIRRESEHNESIV
jgi:hypothetical protein